MVNKKENEVDTETRLVFEVKIIDNSLESETLNFSFSLRELQNLYSYEEYNFFKCALDNFRKAMQGTDSMRAAFLHHLTKFGRVTLNQLTPEYFTSLYQCIGQNR